MFGYVNISCASVRDEDKNLYSAYYCGLCKAIGKKSQIMRLGLNNDLTFLLVLLSAIYDEEPQYENNAKCVIHPFKKHREIKMNKVMDFASDMNILLVYLKVCDDVNDDGKYKGIELIAKRSAQKVIKKYPKISSEIQENLKKLSELENNKCNEIDRVADCFGKVLETIFIPEFIEDENTKKVLSWMGYNIGRWIYIADAYDDMPKDIKKKSYNPLLEANYKSFDELKNNIYNSMTYTLANIANAYDLLDIKRNDTLIRNILYAGLPSMQEAIFKKTEEKNESI